MWNQWHTRNEQRKYSYDGCEKSSPALQCKGCKQWLYHEDLAEGVVPAGFLEFQLNYTFICKHCNRSTGKEECHIRKASWIESIRSSMMHLMWKEHRKQFKVVEIREFILKHWELLAPQRTHEAVESADLAPYFTKKCKPPHNVFIQKK